MAIVEDKSGVRPGRPGNIPAKDPRNRTTRERSTTDDSYNRQLNVNVAIGNQLVLAQDSTRNQLLFITPEGSDVVYLSTSPMTSGAGIPVYAGIGLQIRGQACEQSYYAWGTSATPMNVLIG